MFAGEVAVLVSLDEDVISPPSFFATENHTTHTPLAQCAEDKGDMKVFSRISLYSEESQYLLSVV